MGSQSVVARNAGNVFRPLIEEVEQRIIKQQGGKWVGLAVLALFVELPSSLPAQEIDFKRDIVPILESRCWSCHGEDEESGLRLDLRPNMLRGGDSGLPAVVPGEPKRAIFSTS